MVTSKSFKQRFGAECKAELRRQSLTYARVAPMMKMTEDQLYRRLAGSSAFPIDECAALSVILRVPLATLVQRASA